MKNDMGADSEPCTHCHGSGCCRNSAHKACGFRMVPTNDRTTHPGGMRAVIDHLTCGCCYGIGRIPA